MKTWKLITLLFVTSASLVHADFKLPGKIYKESELAQAREAATKEGKPLSILYSDTETTCPLCSNASLTIIRELSSKTVMVYLSDINKVPTVIQTALKPGEYIPKVAVFDAGLTQSLGMVTYEAIKEDSRKAFRDVERAVREYKKAPGDSKTATAAAQ